MSRKKKLTIAEYNERASILGLVALLSQETFSAFDYRSALLTARRLVRLFEAIEEES